MKIGFIGLGIMGKPMCKNLLKANYDVVATSLIQKDIDDVVSFGAKGVKTSAEVASECDTIITMLPNSSNVSDVCLGKNGIIETAKPGTVVIDMSSIDPTESRRICACLKDKQIDMLDAPVSGGEQGAIDGTLSIMVGGRKELFDKYKELLHIFGTNVTYVGEIGSGNVVKLANQIIVAVNIAALSEACTFAKDNGIDLEILFEAIKGGLAGSSVMNSKLPKIISDNFDPGFKINLHIKDLINALNAGHVSHDPLPLTAIVMEMMQSLVNDGLETSDHSALYKYYQKIAGKK